MGLISRALNRVGPIAAVGEAASDIAEVFHANETRRMELSAEAQRAALSAHGDEFQYGRFGLFDRIVNGFNRLPRPMLALGTLGLFIFAMVDPVAFSGRMVGLNAVPEPLWWLLGAIVSFYFGAREMYYFRSPRRGTLPRMSQTGIAENTTDSAEEANPALRDWIADRERPEHD